MAVIAVVFFIVQLRKAPSDLSGPSIERTNYARYADFSASSTKAEVVSRLEMAFRDHALEELWSIDRPDGAGRLVLAAPTPNGKPNEGLCVDAGDFCGLFADKDGEGKLLVRGARIAGFRGVERFVGANHVVITTGYSLFDYAMIGRYSLDLTTGEMIPRLIIETDNDDHSALLTATGYGDIFELFVDGERLSGRIIPRVIGVRSDKGDTPFIMDRTAVARLADRAAESAEPLDPLHVVPSGTDIDELRVRVDLFGEPFIIDLEAYTIEPLMSSQG